MRLLSIHLEDIREYLVLAWRSSTTNTESYYHPTISFPNPTIKPLWLNPLSMKHANKSWCHFKFFTFYKLDHHKSHLHNFEMGEFAKITGPTKFHCHFEKSFNIFHCTIDDEIESISFCSYNSQWMIVVVVNEKGFLVFSINRQKGN